jgi:thiamine transporter
VNTQGSTLSVDAHSAAADRLNADPSRWSSQALAEMGIAVAMAAVLSWIRIYQMPQGGSVSLEMLPILFVAARRGVVPGMVAGAVFGGISLFGFLTPAPFIFNPLQAVLDYPLAYAALGLAGFIQVRGVGSLAAAIALGTGARFVFHFLSGLLFFASYAPQWEAPWLYSITYNALFLLPEALITALVLWPLLKAYDATSGGPLQTS